MNAEPRCAACGLAPPVVRTKLRLCWRCLRRVLLAMADGPALFGQVPTTTEAGR
jgi:hypothetical protein